MARTETGPATAGTMVMFPTGGSRRSAAPRSGRVDAALADARRCLGDAMRTSDPVERFAAAHLAGLRAGAALLGTYPSPAMRRQRSASVWQQLDRVAPEFADWTAYFAAGSAKRRAAEAGIARQISSAEADEWTRRAAQFIELVADRLVVAA